MILVTGGAGFIGTNLIKSLNKQGITDITISDNINEKKIKNLRQLRFSEYIESKKLIDSEKLNDIKVTIHLGACSSTTEENGGYLVENNYEFTKELYKRIYGKCLKFIYASSASVYGLGKNGFKEVRDSEAPLNLYAFSKLLCDNYFRQKIGRGCGATQVVGLRFFNVYGANESHKGKMASVPFQIYNNNREGNTCKLFEGSENFKRDFIYVNDAVSVIEYFINRCGESAILNCGTGGSRSFSELAKIAGDIIGIKEFETIEFPDKLRGKYQYYTCADINKLRELGYKKEFMSLEEGIKDYYNSLERE